MPSQLALALCLAFSFVLLRRDVKQQKDVSSAVWIPCLWLLILGSRSLSQWLNLGTPVTADAMLDGSPTDRAVYFGLMTSALIVVWRRRLAWGETLWNNPWLLCFLVYCAVSVLWSDFPFVSFKRWFKSLGDPLMVLVLFSELHPAAAVASVLRRCAFVLVPLSVMFIKYYPHLGRMYDDWSGLAFYTGVTTNKNLLGYLLLVFGLLFLCTLITKRVPADKTQKAAQRIETGITVLFLVLIAWLFRMADSQTPLVALFAASGVVLGLWLPPVRRYFGSFAVATLLIGGLLQLFFNLSEVVITSAGRDTTLTGRTDIWVAVLELVENPLAGAGFQSFWLGERLEKMWALFPVFRPNQAHNGYIEMYLNLGWIGLFLFSGLLVASYRTVRERLMRATSTAETKPEDLILAKFGIGYLVAYVLYNVTEAIFQPLNFMFIIFLTTAVRYPLNSGNLLAPAFNPPWNDRRGVRSAGAIPAAWNTPSSSARGGASPTSRWTPVSPRGGWTPRSRATATEPHGTLAGARPRWWATRDETSPRGRWTVSVPASRKP